MTATLEIVTDRMQSVLDRVTELAGHELLVGVPSDNATRDDGPITNAVIGYINEFGAPDMNIPARPHLVPGIKHAMPRVMAILEASARAQMHTGRGQSSPGPLAGFHRAGLIAVASVQAVLTSGEGFAPLAESTLASRRARGRSGTRPLVDSGQYRRSVTYVVRPKG